MKPMHGGNIWVLKNPFRIIDFSTNTNPLGPPKILVEAIKEAVKLGIHRFYPRTDYLDLVIELAKILSVSVENIHVSNGATSILYSIFYLIKPRRTILLEPSFSEYWHLANITHSQITSIRYLDLDDEYVLPLEELLGIIRKTDDNCLLILCNPNNPTGTLIERGIVEEIASSTRCIVLVDEAYSWFTGKPSIVSELVLSYSNLWVMGSLTKIFATPGLRLGYIIAEKNIIKSLNTISPTWRIDSLSYYAYTKTLKEIDLEKYLNETRSLVEIERNYLYNTLRRLRLKPYNSKANFLLVNLNKLIKSKHLVNELLQHNILVRDGSSIPGLSEDYIRIAIRKHEDNIMLVKALEQVLSSGLR